MISEFKLIADSMRRFDAHAVINDPLVGIRCDGCSFYDGNDAALNERTIYFIPSANALEPVRFGQMSGNFLIMQSFSASTLHVPEHSNVIFVPTTEDHLAIYKYLIDCCTAVVEIRSFAAELLGAFLSDESIDEYMEIIGRIFNNPVGLMEDATFSFIANSPHEATKSPQWNQQVYARNLSFDSDDVQSMFRGSFADFREGLQNATLSSYYENDRRLIAGVFCNGTCTHYLAVLENDQPIKESDFFKIEVIAMVLGQYLSLRRADEQEDNMTSVISDAILENDTPTNLERRAHKLDVSFGGSYRMLLLFNINRNAQYRDLVNCLDDVRRSNPRGIATIFRFKVVLLTKEDSTQLDSRLETYLKTKAHDGWRVATSLPFQGMSQISRAYHQCRAAKNLGAEGADVNLILHYEDYLMRHLLHDASQYIDITNYVVPLAREVVEYDRLHRTEYAITLYHYLRLYKDKRAVAERMNIHLNTVKYRLERIEELFGISMKNDVELAHFVTSYDILTQA